MALTVLSVPTFNEACASRGLSSLRRPSRWLLWFSCLGAPLALLAAPDASPQPSERHDQRWGIASYAQDAGLSRQNIFHFAFDPDGTIWVAASDGLFRYDGYNWARFGTEHGLPSHFVRTVCRTRGGDLWVGTDQGSGVFDGRTFQRRGSAEGLAGPSVRRIVEDPDGTLWFASDRWPDASVSSGLSSYRDGRWTRYGTADGLPSDHLYDYFRDTSGRQFALTLAGVRQKNGEHWVPPPAHGGLATADCRSMAESPRLGVVARTTDGMFIRQDDRWVRGSVESSRTGAPLPVAATRGGEIVTGDYDGQRFAMFAWTGRDIVPISPPIDEVPHTVEYLAEAPDGAIWYCHFGALVRWERSGHEWTEYQHLPFPRLIDRRGHVWFADRETAFRWTGTRFEPQPELAGELARDGSGDVLSWNGTEPIRRFDGQTHTYGRAVTGLLRVGGHTLDAEGRSWFDGVDADGHALVVLFDGATWTPFPVNEAPVRFVSERVTDPKSGIWLLMLEPNNRSVACVHVDEHGVRKETIEYSGAVQAPPHLAVDAEGTLWLSGQTGMYRRPAGAGGWEHVRNFPGNHVGRGVVRRDEVWFPFTGWTGGQSGFAAFRAGQWHSFTADSSDPVLSTGDRVLYVGTEQGLMVVAPDALRTGDAPSQLSVPQGQRVHTLVKRAATEIRQDRLLAVEANARERFAPRRSERTYRYSWRVDGGAWSAFHAQPPTALSVAGLRTGPHQLEIRAQDEGLDVDRTPAKHDFAVLPVPLQERSWFRPAVFAALAAILALAVLAIERARRLAQVNVQLHAEIAERRRAEQSLQAAHDGLEHRVAERTAALSSANTQLQAEALVRQRAQTELEATQHRLVEASRQAGMAEVATSVLHNVGNVLNSVNVSATIVADRLRESKLTNLSKVAALLETHASDLGTFLTADPKGQKIPSYLSALAAEAAAERELTDEELNNLRHKVEHIKEIVSMQQSYASVSGVTERLGLVGLIEDAIRLNATSMTRHGVEIVRAFTADPTVVIDRHRVMQILVNLIRNAKEACEATGRSEKRVTIGVCKEPGWIHVTVQDNGVGIAAENLTRIFGHGFTTKENGHGYGLHNSALVAKELGGSLRVESAGPRLGATFTLTLPA